jgi:hypothetical protein
MIARLQTKTSQRQQEAQQGGIHTWPSIFSVSSCVSSCMPSSCLSCSSQCMFFPCSSPNSRTRSSSSCFSCRSLCNCSCTSSASKCIERGAGMLIADASCCRRCDTSSCKRAFLASSSTKLRCSCAMLSLSPCNLGVKPFLRHQQVRAQGEQLQQREGRTK